MTHELGSDKIRYQHQGPLRQVFQGPLPLANEEGKIRDAVSTYGWNWSAIPFGLPPNCKKEHWATPFPMETTSQDIGWKQHMAIPYFSQ